MIDWQRLLISSEISIIQAIEILDKTAKKILVVVDSDRKVLGTLTDGDIRRALLKKVDFESPVSSIMNSNPFLLFESKIEFSGGEIKLATERGITKIPIITENRVIVGIFDSLRDFSTKKKSNVVVLMAGGLGSRLKTLTKDCPKPMLKVGEKPILETILLNFKRQGFYRFLISVNYQSEVIKKYFGDGSKYGVEVSYLEEETRLGTAGPLGLIEQEIKEPLIVMNGDLLTTIDFNDVLEFHSQQKSMATICVKEYDFQVPYGVVELKDHNYVQEIKEKPKHSFFVNAGAYVLDPKSIHYVDKGKAIDMPNLLEKFLGDDEKVSAFPIREYWLDIGKPDDFKKAQVEFNDVFENE